jgi:hypothetical protein
VVPHGFADREPDVEAGGLHDILDELLHPGDEPLPFVLGGVLPRKQDFALGRAYTFAARRSGRVAARRRTRILT